MLAAHKSSDDAIFILNKPLWEAWQAGMDIPFVSFSLEYHGLKALGKMNAEEKYPRFFAGKNNTIYTVQTYYIFNAQGQAGKVYSIYAVDSNDPLIGSDILEYIAQQLQIQGENETIPTRPDFFIEGNRFATTIIEPIKPEDMELVSTYLTMIKEGKLV